MSNLIDDELWDHYSGLPNPLWWNSLKEDEEETTSDSNDTEVDTE